MTRDEFKQLAIKTFSSESDYWKNIILNDLEPFWAAEHSEGWKASYFCICWVGAVNASFWNWCDNNLSKRPICYMCDEYYKKEWWGFNTEKDMVAFLLRFAI